MSGLKIVKKIKHKVGKFFLTPIEVFVFHAVSDSFDERCNKLKDWSQTQDFKNHILWLKKRYRFITLEECYRKLKKQRIRFRHYAVMTCDDGYASVLQVLPFLEEQQVPMTLFINPKYLDGKSKREGYAESPIYITENQLWGLNSSWVTIGMHGYEHLNATKQSKEDFVDSVRKCKEMLQGHPGYIPYFAYTWGLFSEGTQRVLDEMHVVPVLTSGEGNQRFKEGIDRRPMDSYYWKVQVRRLRR